MEAMISLFPVPEMFPNRPLEELEAERYRIEQLEARRSEERKEQERDRLKRKSREKDRAEVPSYMGIQVDLLA